jgi:hypothetical protein
MGAFFFQIQCDKFQVLTTHLSTKSPLIYPTHPGLSMFKPPVHGWGFPEMGIILVTIHFILGFSMT